jgi:protein O-mannosyl-transferase
MQNLLRAAMILGAGLWVFFPALHGDWLMDDGIYIIQNPLRHDPERLWKIWFEPGSFIEYYPLGETVQWLQWHLWQDTPFGYHLTNVILHLTSALLVWRLLARFGLQQAWLGGLLFAIHPVVVESVAWMAELKNTLSLPPFLLSMLFYLDYEEHGRKRDYRVALLLFLVAMLCKVSMMFFPGVILLYAWWKRRRIRWDDLKVALPFLLISIPLVLITILSGVWYRQFNTGPEDPVPIGGFFSHLALIGLTVSFYFYKCMLPLGLLFVYPQWNINPPSLAQFLPWPILAGGVFWLWTRRRSWGRHALLGLGFFLLNIAPVTGVVTVSYMTFTWVMDHFLYIPIIGLIGVVVAGWEIITTRLSGLSHSFCVMGMAAVMALLGYESHAYAGVFVDQETLWTYTLAHNPAAWMAYNNLGLIYQNQGLIDPAMVDYQEALRVNPNLTGPHINLGNCHKQRGEFEAAIVEYRAALQINPNDAEAENNWGNALCGMAQFGEAITRYQTALHFQPNYAQAHDNLGVALTQVGNTKAAMVEYRKAISLQPDNADAHYNLGIAIASSGDPAGSIDEFEKATALAPEDPANHFNLAVALTQAGRIPEAIHQYEEVLRLNPQSTAAATNLAQLKAMER